MYLYIAVLSWSFLQISASLWPHNKAKANRINKKGRASGDSDVWIQAGFISENVVKFIFHIFCLLSKNKQNR